jgi:hypothetical protein
MMKRIVPIFGWLAGAVFMVPSAGLGISDSYDSGFYTRGIDAASYMDQGGAVIDPFYIPATTGALLPRVSLAVTHEDNIFLDAKGTNQGTSVTLVPGLLAIWGRPTGNHLYADYGLIIPVYESVKELNDRPSHMLRLGSVYGTGKSQVQGQLGYSQREDVDAVVGARVAKQDFTGDLSVEHRISGKSSVGMQGRVEKHDFDAEDYADYNRYYGAGRLYHRATPKSQVFIQAGIGRDDPRETKDSALGADFYDLSLGVRGKQSPKFNATGRVGYMWRSYDEERRENLEHWIASLRAESSPFGLTTFTGELYADVRPAIDSKETDVVDQGVIGTVSRRMFIERLRGNASATFGRIDYSGKRQAGASAGGEGDRIYDGRSDNYWGFSLGVDWWTRDRFSVGLAYSYIQREGSQNADSATQEATSYEYGRWTLRASWNY